jgi:hypothetical protein
MIWPRSTLRPIESSGISQGFLHPGVTGDQITSIAKIEIKPKDINVHTTETILLVLLPPLLQIVDVGMPSWHQVVGPG